MRLRVIAVLLATCIPAVAFAQKGKSGGGAAGGDMSTNSGGPAPKPPTAHELTDMNPAALLLDKKKKLSLADSQVAQLKVIQKKINERNAQLMSQYDSVRRLAVPPPAPSRMGLGSVSDADKANAAMASSPAVMEQRQQAMGSLRNLIANFRARHIIDEGDAMSVIQEVQQKAAADFITQQDVDLDNLVGPARP